MSGVYFLNNSYRQDESGMGQWWRIHFNSKGGFMKKLMTYEEMAQRLGIAQGTLYSWVSRKRIPHVRFGPRCVRFDPKEVEEWVELHSLNRDVGGIQEVTHVL